MTAITKNQHYVWRKYLSAWTNNGELNGKISVYRKKQELLANNTSLENVASGNYTYCYHEVNAADVNFLRLYIKRLDSKFDVIKPFLENITMLLENHSGRNDYFEKNLVCKIEDSGIPFLEKLRNGDTSFIAENPITVFLNDYNQNLQKFIFFQKPIPKISEEIIQKALNNDYDDSLFDFIQFLTFQFFRTRTAKKANEDALKSMKEQNDKWDDVNSDTIYMAMLMIDSFVMAHVISNKNYKVTLLKNDADEPFIVSDTPVINIDFNPDMDEIPKSLRLYYPITPKIAIIVAEKNLVINSKVDDNNVKIFNNHIFKQAFNEVYATEKLTLEKYITE